MSAAAFPMLPDLPDGIYFGMPDEVYFAIPRLSASGIQKLLVSPATFWADSWLNAKRAVALAGASLAAMAATPEAARPPYFAEIDAKLRAAFPDAAKAAPGKDATKARNLGKAYHAARLEGPDALNARFVRKPAMADFPGTKASPGGGISYPTLWTGPDIEKALAALEQPKTKAGESVADKGQRLAELGYGGIIFPVVMADWEADRGERVAIDAEQWDDLIVDMERLRDSEVAAKLLTGGVPEVSILWTDGGGVRWKCRIDYLTPHSWTDLKTFDNWSGKHLDQALCDLFRFNRHHVQGGVYREPIELLRADVLPIVGPSTELQRQVIGRIATSPAELECWFVYQEKGGVPNILGRQMEFHDVPLNTRIQHAGASEEGIAAVEEATRTLTFVYRRARGDIAKARQSFVDYLEIFQPGRPWRPWQAMRKFDDADFPDFWLRNE